MTLYIEAAVVGIAALLFCLFVFVIPKKEPMESTKDSSGNKNGKGGFGVQKFFGFTGFDPLGIKTEDGSVLALFEVTPNNLTVLPAHVIHYQIWHMQMLLQQCEEVELLALDGSETGEENLRFLNARIAEEENPAVKVLLEQDRDSFVDAHFWSTSIRQFTFVLRLKGTREQMQRRLDDFEKRLADHRFTAHRMNRAELKHILGIYYSNYMYAETIEEEGRSEDEKGKAENRDENGEGSFETPEEGNKEKRSTPSEDRAGSAETAGTESQRGEEA